MQWNTCGYQDSCEGGNKTNLSFYIQIRVEHTITVIFHLYCRDNRSNFSAYIKVRVEETIKVVSYLNDFLYHIAVGATSICITGSRKTKHE